MMNRAGFKFQLFYLCNLGTFSSLSEQQSPAVAWDKQAHLLSICPVPGTGMQLP